MPLLFAALLVVKLFLLIEDNPLLLFLRFTERLP
jgi:hypothetical protein